MAVVQWTARYGRDPRGAIVQPCWKLVCLQSCRVVSKWWYFCSSPQMKHLSFSSRKHLHLLRKLLWKSVEKIFLFFACVRVYNTIRLSKPPSVITAYWNIFCSGARLKKYLRFDTTRHDVCLEGYLIIENHLDGQVKVGDTRYNWDGQVVESALIPHSKSFFIRETFQVEIPKLAYVCPWLVKKTFWR